MSVFIYCGYRPIKFVGTKDHDGAAKSTSDWPLMRAAEVYLNYAEAKAELGTLKQEDLDISINKIRERANWTPSIESQRYFIFRKAFLRLILFLKKYRRMILPAVLKI